MKTKLVSQPADGLQASPPVEGKTSCIPILLVPCGPRGLCMTRRNPDRSMRNK